MKNVEAVNNSVKSSIDISDKNPNESRIDSLLEWEGKKIKEKTEKECQWFDEYIWEKKDEIESFCSREFLKLPNQTFITAFFDKELLWKSS